MAGWRQGGDGMLQLRVRAPFAACRPFAAGYHRPTAEFVTPSAAYGLLLNLAGIESRYDDGAAVMTLTAPGLPTARLAIGMISEPQLQSLYQQLHNYPVSTGNPDREREARGNKYNIQPIRRAYLSNIDAYLCLDGNQTFEEQVRLGLVHGADYAPAGRQRYGLPFLGDNSFLLSSVVIDTEPLPAFWLRQVAREALVDATNLDQLTVWVDRADQTRTMTRYFSRDAVCQVEVPETAWTAVGPPP